MAIRHALPGGLRYALRDHYNQARSRGLWTLARRNLALTDAWIRAALNRRHFRELTETAVRAQRKSDTVFIFGSGYSLNELAPADWSHFRQHDVFGFNNFVYEKWIPIDFHLLRGGVESSELVWRAYAEEFTGILNANPHCANTTFLVQRGYFADFCNRLIGYRYLRQGAKIFPYHTNRDRGLPTGSFREGIRHMNGTLCDAVNAAAVLGWRHLVLVGVDLYDSRYFWLGPDETYRIADDGRIVGSPVHILGYSAEEQHVTAQRGVVAVMGEWCEWLARERGIAMSVYNPRSLLADVMPTYVRPHE